MVGRETITSLKRTFGLSDDQYKAERAWFTAYMIQKSIRSVKDPLFGTKMLPKIWKRDAWRRYRANYERALNNPAPTQTDKAVKSHLHFLVGECWAIIRKSGKQNLSKATAKFDSNNDTKPENTVIPTGNLAPVIKNLYFNIVDPDSVAWGVRGPLDALSDIWYPWIDDRTESGSIGRIEDFDVKTLYRAAHSAIPDGRKIRAMYGCDVSIPDDRTSPTKRHIFHLWNDSSVAGLMSTVASNRIDILVVLFREAIDPVTGVVRPQSPTITGKPVYPADITDTVNDGEDSDMDVDDDDSEADVVSKPIPLMRRPQALYAKAWKYCQRARTYGNVPTILRNQASFNGNAYNVTCFPGEACWDYNQKMPPATQAREKGVWLNQANSHNSQYRAYRQANALTPAEIAADAANNYQMNYDFGRRTPTPPPADPNARTGRYPDGGR
jgi:hypothetical protein